MGATRFQVGGTSIRVATDQEPIRIYEDDDPSEDYYMVAKDLTQELGIGPALERLSFGQARYGERIFDQKSNLLQKAIMRSHRSNQEKKRLLGEHIFSELLTHADFGGPSNVRMKAFAQGGPVETLRSILTQRLRTLESQLRVQQNKVSRLKRQNRDADGFGGAVNRVFGENPVIERQDLAELKTETDQVRSLLEGIRSGDVKYTQKGFVNGKGQVIAGNAEIFAENPVYYAQRYAAYKQAADAGLETEQNPVQAEKLTRQQRESRAVAEGRAQYLSDNHAAKVATTTRVSSKNPDAPIPANPGVAPFAIATPESSKPIVLDFQKAYNNWARQNGLVEIKEDGTYGPVTKRAIDNWNLNKPAWDQLAPVTGTVIDPNTGKSIQNLVGIRKPDEIKSIEDRPEMNTQNPLQDGLAGIRQGLENGTALQKPVSPAASQGMGPFERQNLFANLTDLARAGVGALTAYQNPVPRYSPPESYTRMQNEVYRRRNQGFSPEEQAAINHELENNYAANLSAIKDIAGGGASQGAVLSALGRAGAQLHNNYLNSALQNVQQKRANYANYQNAVLRDLNLGQMQFEQDRQSAFTQRQAGLGLLDSALSNIAGRQQYNMQFGPGTLYDQLQTQQLGYIQSQKGSAKRLPDVYMNLLEAANTTR